LTQPLACCIFYRNRRIGQVSKTICAEGASVSQESNVVRPTSEFPTDLELQILKVLWELEPQPVRDIRDALAAQGRDIAHTSVITTLNKMFDKGYVKRSRDGNAFLFSARVTKEEVAQKMLAKVVDRVFGGSTSAVMLSLFDRGEIDTDELKELRRLVNRKLKGE
jgi:BlaI family transcriptional regulator, penicillinase repressor